MAPLWFSDWLPANAAGEEVCALVRLEKSRNCLSSGQPGKAANGDGLSSIEQPMIFLNSLPRGDRFMFSMLGADLAADLAGELNGRRP
jgi:hypothetical protein